MGRRDFENDPDAPPANSLVPAASAIVVNSDGQVLLQLRSDNGMWALPGGVMEIGESLPDCAIRETQEESGLTIEIAGLVGTYTNPLHVFAYDDGEVRQEFSVCFLARPVGGSLVISPESTDVRWFAPADIAAVPMVPSIRKRVTDYLSGRYPVFS